MNATQRAELFAMRAALDNFVAEIADIPAKINENPAAVRVWQPGSFVVGDVRQHKGNPYRCVQGHDSTGNEAWAPDAAPALWMQYHGTSLSTARPWVQPTGAHDLYKTGEWMVWTDGLAYPCKTDTTYSPAEYPAAWGTPSEVAAL